MTNPQSLAEHYLAFWNATDASERERRFVQHWAPGAVYVDPVMRGTGAEDIGALAAGVRERFPGFAFRLLGAPDGYGDYVRFRWALGPAGAEAPIEGSDVIKLREGRIAEVIGFLDKVPS